MLTSIEDDIDNYRIDLQREYVKRQLGPGGVGAAVLNIYGPCRERQILTDEWLQKFPWRDNHSTFVNERGLTVVQRHDVYAVKLSESDRRLTALEKNLAELAWSIARFVRALYPAFPVLENWQADEVSMHNYDEPEIGLSRHRDNYRFWGVVAVLTLRGSSDFVIYGDGLNGQDHVFQVGPGDLALMRATNLTGDRRNTEYQKRMNPEHGVVNVRSIPRTSLIVRNNLRPKEAVPGFIYENWTPKSSDRSE